MTEESIKRNIRAATLLWMASVLLSRMMGFVREIIIARQAGANAETDVYFTAFTIPDFVNYMLAGSALSITFIPIFAGYLVEKNEEEGWRAFSAITTFIGVVLTGLILMAMIFTPQLASIVAKGFTDAQRAELVHMTRIILPAQLFHFEGFLLSAVQMAKGQHRYAAFSSLVYNSGIILGGLLLGPTLGMEGFCWGVLVGAFVGSFLLQLYGARKIGLRWRPNFDYRHPGLVRYVKLSLPIMLGQSLIMWDEWLIRRFGSFLTAASISWLNYGRKLAMVPQAVFAQAAGTASYPHLARQAAEGQIRDLHKTLITALRSVLVLALGAQIFLMVLSNELCFILFRNDRFTDQDVASTAGVLLLFSLGIAAWSMQGIVARGYYAFRDTISPTVIGTGMTLLSVPLYWALSRSMGHIGLALGSTLAITAYASVLYLGFVRKVRKREPDLNLEPLWPFLLRLVAACIMTGAVALAVRKGMLLLSGEQAALARWLEIVLSTGAAPSMKVAWVMAFFRCVAVVVLGGAAWVLFCLLFGVREIVSVMKRVLPRLIGEARARRLMRRWVPAGLERNG